LIILEVTFDEIFLIHLREALDSVFRKGARLVILLTELLHVVNSLVSFFRLGLLINGLFGFSAIIRIFGALLA
jgi:hypothetical protein